MSPRGEVVFFSSLGGELAIGDNVFFNNHCSVTCFGKIEIGDNTFFGEGVKMYDHNHKHEFRENGLYAFPTEFKIGQIKIGKNCWVASNVTILNNVTIGDSVIVGAGCLVYKTVPSNTIVMEGRTYLQTGKTRRFIAGCPIAVRSRATPALRGLARPTLGSGLRPVADENPVFGPPERYRAERGFSDQRLHFPKQGLAFGSHLFVINGDVEKAEPLRR